MPTIDLRRRLVELNAQILEQKRALRDLQQTRVTVERELRETATYPILTLPVEITTEIFHRLPFETVYSSASELWRNMSPVLAAVCRSWRGIALSTPKLWSTMELSFDSIPSTVIAEPGKVELFVNRWLGRSGECPLSLAFTLHQIDHFPLSRLRTIVHQYAYRTRYIKLDLGGLNPMDALQLYSLSFPSLQAASFHGYSNLETHVFGNAPQLHSLHVLPFPEGIVPARFHLPWQQLTTFEGPVHHLDLFIVAPNLIDVKCKQSSPPLISLRARAAEREFAQWYKAVLHVAGTLEDLELSSSSPEIMASIFSSWGPPRNWRTLTALSNLKTLRFSHLSNPPWQDQLVHFLYSRSDILCSFQLLWDESPYLYGRTEAGAPGAPAALDTLVGHFSRLRAAGMDVHVGTEDENYAATNEVYWAGVRRTTFLVDFMGW
ncbi:hypothetical protein B0H16DRAFT_1877749 [Mycena metata]|uniref:F-box domain-containing protein n=1 Tax=Mycena metata TaxID=1033252 RepID=A0AAD7K918_9AGAR|nr:hypothetical protein B0H16DRAFT_1877749 [Mycena metata]